MLTDNLIIRNYLLLLLIHPAFILFILAKSIHLSCFRQIDETIPVFFFIFMIKKSLQD